MNASLLNPGSCCSLAISVSSPVAPCGTAQPDFASRPTSSHQTSVSHGPVSFVSIKTARRSSHRTCSLSPLGLRQTIDSSSHATAKPDSGCNCEGVSSVAKSRRKMRNTKAPLMSKLTHSRRSRVCTAMMMLEFHKPDTCPARRLSRAAHCSAFCVDGLAHGCICCRICANRSPQCWAMEPAESISNATSFWCSEFARTAVSHSG